MKKLTVIDMEWTDTGSVVKTTTPIECPRCGVTCPANSEHRCGDKATPIEGQQ